MATRRSVLTAIAGAALAILLAIVGPLRAQQKYPDRPIRMIVPFPPGGPIDTMARVVGAGTEPRASARWSSKTAPAAARRIGTKLVAAAEPDGYTLLFGSSGSLAVAPALYSSLGIDPRKAFAPVATVALLPHVFVVNLDVPAKTIARIRRLCQGQSRQDQFRRRARHAAASAQHACSRPRPKIDVVYVPYTGSAQSVNDLLGGRTQFTIDGLVTLYPLIKAGKVRALAVARAERWPALPDVPTLVESGYPDFVIDAWTGVVAPAGTPRAIVDQAQCGHQRRPEIARRAGDSLRNSPPSPSSARRTISESSLPTRRSDGARS